MQALTILLILTMFASACGPLTGKSTGANDLLLDGSIGGISFLELESGKFLFQGSMENGGDAAHNFELKFKLPQGQRPAFYFFSERNLGRGLKLQFSRDTDKVVMELELNGVRHSLTFAPEQADMVHLSVDIHNDHEDAHIIVWRGQGPFSDSEDCVEQGQCLYNTEYFTSPNPGPWGGQGRASGIFWGFEGDKDLLIELSGPKKALSNA